MIFLYLKKGLVLVISDLLSLITVVLCLIQKIPQIRDLYGYKSARGISPLSLYLELFTYSAMMLYNYCYDYQTLTYLEYPVLLIQQYILIYLVLKYKRLLVPNTYYAVGGYALVVFLFVYNILPKFLLAMVVPLCTPIGASSKIIQLAEIIRNKDAATVSLTTWFISAFTNLTRIYTVSVSSGDTMLLTNFTISFLLSLAVYLAASYFKRQRTVIVVKKSVVLKWEILPFPKKE